MTLEISKTEADTIVEKLDQVLNQFTEVLELDPDMLPNIEQSWVFPTNTNIPLIIRARIEDLGFQGKFFVLMIECMGYQRMATRRWKLIRK